ncbi:hypothetical protein [Bacillus thuringiensis]|uniref:hypothetical protein n=1 Tax=Bacillus thuringiensis TaxID=1428 RepID=UPI0004ABE5C7|nr:hypothetical protein [Bacillus thuringiensis]AIE31569.1 phage protein [Bacillus thuringiensis serovar kurstaki str. HD-1]
MANNKLKINIDTETHTSEALKQMKEVTEVANECVAALEKLEKVIGRFTNNNDSIEIEVPLFLNGKQIAEAITKVEPSGKSQIALAKEKELQDHYECEWCHKDKAIHIIKDLRYGEERKICTSCYLSIAQKVVSNNMADKMRKNI